MKEPQSVRMRLQRHGTIRRGQRCADLSAVRHERREMLGEVRGVCVRGDRVVDVRRRAVAVLVHFTQVLRNGSAAPGRDVGFESAKLFRQQGRRIKTQYAPIRHCVRRSEIVGPPQIVEQLRAVLQRTAAFKVFVILRARKHRRAVPAVACALLEGRVRALPPSHSSAGVLPSAIEP